MKGVLLAAAALLAFLPAASACTAQYYPLIDVDVQSGHPCMDRGRERECHDAPTPDHPVVLDATVTWSSVDSAGCTAQSNLPEDVHIDFAVSKSNPDWIGVSFSPPYIDIPLQEQVEPENAVIGPDRMGFEVTRPFQVTLTHEHPPSAAELRAYNGGANQLVIIKAIDPAGGSTSPLAAFGSAGLHLDTKAYRTTADAGEPAKSTPGFGLPALSTALAVMILAAARRKA